MTPEGLQAILQIHVQIDAFLHLSSQSGSGGIVLIVLSFDIVSGQVI